MKLEAGVSALVNDDQDVIDKAKKIYYTNSINFADNIQMRKKCRVTNSFYEFT